MNTASLSPAKSAINQAARAAVVAYRAGFHQEAAILWRAAIAAWGAQQ